MKKLPALCFLAALGFVLTAFDAETTLARSQYRTQFLKVYKEGKIGDAAKEAKCNVCHYGKKKNRNDYGMALSKHLTKEVYTEFKKDKESLNKKITESLEAVLEEKAAGGETFAELIEAGKLPGTAPEE